MKPLLLLLFASMLLPAQERVLLRIGEDGRQEAVRIRKGETNLEAIRRIVDASAAPAGRVDTIMYYDQTGDFASYFPFTRGDVALQWYATDAACVVKEFWWRNGLKTGFLNKANLRFWRINPALTKLPGSPTTRFLGTWRDVSADEGVTPFPPKSGNTYYSCSSIGDSVIGCIPPFLSEIPMLVGDGAEVLLKPNVWQNLVMEDVVDSVVIKANEPFGFTIENVARKADLGTESDVPMEIIAWPNANSSPYHSFKFYRQGRTAPANAGWHLRGDYEWQMFVIVELIGDRPPKLSNIPLYGTTLSTSARAISATITDDNPGGGAAGVASARLFSKLGSASSYDSVSMTKSGSVYTGNAKAGAAGDTIYWYITATDVNGNRATTPVRSYIIFKKSKDRLFLYNNAGFSRSNASLIYTGSSTGGGKYDYWSVPNDGVSELPSLLALYEQILIVDGSFPARNVYAALKSRIEGASIAWPVNVFISSQDYGCFIQQQCADTTFTAGSMEYDYFGISKIGPQDVPPINREFRVVPQADTVTNYLIKFGMDSGSTLWCDPTFELGFSSYQDNIVPRPGVKVVLTDGGSNTWAVRYSSAKAKCFFTSIDIGALQFRSDTSLVASSDPKYKWVPTDVGALPNAFFRVYRTCPDCWPFPIDTLLSVEDGTLDKFAYGLGQNYPNPFNPVTLISYSVAASGPVTITVYNAIGQRVAVLVNETKGAGEYAVEWNAVNVPSGLYFYEMRAGAFTSVKKMLLLK